MSKWADEHRERMDAIFNDTRALDIDAVVLDTNIYIDACLDNTESKTSRENIDVFRYLFAGNGRRFPLIISDAINAEIRKVLEVNYGCASGDVSWFLGWIGARAMKVNTISDLSVEAMGIHKGDSAVVTTALSGRAGTIVTKDRALKGYNGIFGLRILRSIEYLILIEEEGRRADSCRVLQRQ